MRLLVPYLAAVGLVGVLAACGNPSTSSEGVQTAPTVQAPVAPVEKRSVQAVYEAVGTIRAKVSSTIQSKMMGNVWAVNVKDGDQVEAGQTLIEIDKREAEAQVRQAESALREAQEAQQDVGNAVQAAMRSKDAAEANKSLAAATFARYKGLADSQAISRQVFDEADASLKEAVAEAARAAETVQSFQAKRREADARVEQVRAELSSAQTLLSYAQITAPFAGIITHKTVDVGDMAAPGSPLLVLENQQQYRLETLVDEDQVHSITTGMRALVTVDALAGSGAVGKPQTESAHLDGTVAEIVPSADPASRTFVVKIDLPQDPAIRSGMFGRAQFDVGQRQALVIPETAVLHRGQLVGVYVVDSAEIAQLRLITIGKRYDSGIEVLSGLVDSERIVVDKVSQITDGAKIQQR